MHALGRRRAAAAVAVASVAALSACGEVDGRLVRLVRVEPPGAGDCGLAADGRAVRVSALGDFPVSETTARFLPVGEDGDGANAVAIDQFPGDTRVLEVVVLGPGAAPQTEGRTGPLDFADLGDGAEVPLFMAPPRGVCPTGSMTAARREPLVARAGAGVLIAGGVDESGAALASVERYDPSTGAFVEVASATYASGALGLTGATLTELADGRVVLAGGSDQAFATYDPVDDEFSSALFLAARRAFHAAVALPDGRLFAAGGCSELDAMGRCEPGTARADSVVIDVDTGEQTPGPPLAGARVGGRAILEDGGRVLIVGGVDDAGTPVERAERVDALRGAASQGLAEVAGAPARLASGATLVAFAVGAAPSDQVFAVPPGRASGARLAAAPSARGGAGLVALDDGTVLAVGGTTAAGAAPLALFEPLDGTFAALGADAPGLPRSGSGAARLDDGTVLIVGGAGGAGGADDGGAAVATAFVFRPELTHEFSSRLQIAASDSTLVATASPSDADRVRRVAATADTAAHVRLEGRDGAATGVGTYVVGGGPAFADASVEARVAVEAGGLALLFGFRGAADFVAATLRPGAIPRVRRIAGGVAETACEGAAAVETDRLADAVVRLEVRDARVRMQIAGVEILDCELDERPPRGLVGVGTIGGAEARVRLERLTADR